jgi:eukaryotic-like serine/threonine-protein kinase
VSPAARFSVAAPLPPQGEWRRALALDHSGAEPTAVVLAFVPQSVVDDPARLAALVRDVEAAGRLHHPAAVPVLGTETIGERLAIVEPHRSGTPLRALLDAGGRLPPDVAVRIAIDACAAVARAHALEAGDGRKLVHGAIDPSRILVAEDGAALVTGFGMGSAAEPAEDVRALAAILHECLAGEPPGQPPAPLEEAGVGAALAAAVARPLGAGADAAVSASALAGAVAAAGPVASHADVAAYVDAILPPGEGARGELARALADAGAPAVAEAEEVSEDYIVEPTEPAVRRPEPAAAAPAGRPERAAGAEPSAPPEPAVRTEPARAASAVRAEPTPEPLPRPPSTRPGADPAGVFAAPPRPAKRSRAPAVVAIACLVIGFAGGYEAFRHVRISIVREDAATAATSPPTSTVDGTAVHREPVDKLGAGSAPAAEGEARSRRASTATAASTSASTSTGTGSSAQAPAATGRPAARADVAKRTPPAKKPMKAAARAAPAPAAATATAADDAPKTKGMLHVAAPEDAEVFLDARRIGKGNVDVEIPAGAHRVEVRRGEARVAESFTLGAGETWTYDVTPTP